MTYRDQAGKLSGGAAHSSAWDRRTVSLGCRAVDVYLSDGQRVPLSCIRAVGKTDQQGQILEAWTTREHGYDGEWANNS